MALARVYPIVDSAAWVARLLPLGVQLIQLRIKQQPQAQLRREIAAARALCAAAGAQLVVNDYWQLALELGCEWVHLGQGDLESADVAALRRAGVRLGISTHDHAELERALSWAPDYVALGPIYPTLLKQMPWAPQGLARLTEWKQRLGGTALVAIGGLTAERLGGVFAAGADSAAVVTDIVRHPQPEQRLREWLLAAAPAA
ncbi:MAG TPA: thiamine phosphate synthase [Steroidobacteraceae bacterium]|jgi:thiamine-phosphate pyrophosphorylase|nr:thiamine phosphate synthase [Steroidobacteraceae bacterium]